MSRKRAAFVAAFLFVAAILFIPVRKGSAYTAYTTLWSQWIQSSLIDSTPIGSTTPSTGAFTTSTASGGYTGNLTGNVTGNLTGNASTATALAATPSQCTGGGAQFATGIQANGTANCTSFPAITISSGYQKLESGLIFEWGQASSGVTGDVPITFPLQFPTAVLSVAFGSDNTGADAGRNSCYVSAWSGTGGVTGFTASSGGSTNNCHWLAIGY